MLESNLSILIVSALKAGLTARGLTAMVKKDNQPRQQGVPTGATVFFHHIFTKKVGWPEKSDRVNKTTGLLEHTEIQRLESRYQIGALAPTSLTEATAPLAADYVNAASAIMQSNVTQALFLASGVGVQKPGDTNLTYFVDDKGQNEANPTFDIILSHQDSVTTPGTKITSINANIAQV